MSKTRIGGIMRRNRLAKIGVLASPDRPGVAAAVVSALGSQGINVPFIASSVDQHGFGHITLCVDIADLEVAVAMAEGVRSRIHAGAIVPYFPVASIGIFGPDFRERPGIAADMFEALASRGINMLGISTSISTISCVIDEDRLEDSIAALQATFELP